LRLKIELKGWHFDGGQVIKNERYKLELREDKSYWENIRNLDIDFNYDFKSEANNFWKKYKKDIETDGKQIEVRNNTKEKEIEFLNAYEKYKDYKKISSLKKVTK